MTMKQVMLLYNRLMNLFFDQPNLSFLENWLESIIFYRLILFYLYTRTICALRFTRSVCGLGIHFRDSSDLFAIKKAGGGEQTLAFGRTFDKGLKGCQFQHKSRYL